jgi:Demerecviridae HNH endonuclease
VVNFRAVLDYNPLTGLFTRISGQGAGGSVTPQGYLRIRVNNKDYQAHRLAWWFAYGKLPASPLDHINGDKSDNRIANLRLATKQQNAANMKPRHAGLKGAWWRKDRKKWCAHINRDYKTYHLGTFDTEAEAHAAYCAAAVEFFGEFARFE